MFKINAMDHIVLNVPDIDRSLAFYMDVLGLEAERLDNSAGERFHFLPCASARTP
jgi:catechol 2,3-dioxygenase-like lactoylglutathione lyase family enzyme